MVSSAPPASHPVPPVKLTDFSQAITDMRAKSYYGFVILLDMLNTTTKSTLSQEVTFFMPIDSQLAEYPISPDKLVDFILSHSIPEPLVFSELAHVPTGTLIPSFLSDQFRISKLGRHVFVNNAQIVAPNVCSSTTIRCHGINAVIDKRKNRLDLASSTLLQGNNTKS
ncbi:Fasciclin-like arabinogalactan family protein [Thalictrum thalictroides]|uniref:Fasciclin-like arabinogalactan family protein n=1 Tax=Thalictrum thalictroides TaxID=46969 RepID=A0A7J6X4T5_THATH|nr:Fasciclin-like arabinogalactan family protein [Thalictrum thalictroides]